MVDNQAAPTPQIVDISDLTVNGTDQQDALPPYGASDRFFAIGYHNASGTVQNVHTTNTRQTVNFNQLAGGGIVNASDLGSVSFNITSCLIDFYQRAGIDCRGSALTAHVLNNTVDRGFILTPNTSTATPNGIQISRQASGSVTNNIVKQNIATVFGSSATGILLIRVSENFMVSGNTTDSNDVGIIGINCDNNLLIDLNTVNFTLTPGINPPEGIAIHDPLGLTTITSNVMNQIPNIEMNLVSSTNQPFSLANNRFIGGQTGLLVTGNMTTGPVVTMNSDSFTGTVGFYIQEVAAPNDIWPSTATVFFDGLLSGHMTQAEFDFVDSKIFDRHDDPALGLVLEFIPPSPPTVTGISPSSGPESGGTLVSITGSNFISSNTRVFFGSNQALNVIVVSDKLIIATAPPGGGVVDVIVVTSIGTSPATPASAYFYNSTPPPPVTPPLPPSHFTGIVRVKRHFILKATWDPSPSPDVSAYRVYKGNKLIEQIPAASPLEIRKKAHTLRSFKKYRIVAVNAYNLESFSVPLKIVCID